MKRLNLLCLSLLSIAILVSSCGSNTTTENTSNSGEKQGGVKKIKEETTNALGEKYFQEARTSTLVPRKSDVPTILATAQLQNQPNLLAT